ncbi:hypothetical protein VNO77_29386 [Canavalia gladiata]|uniref:Uncharacterized protein n=1 Tax=Canavalia gladiata TaxID=3824 RepID=A0AAN9KX34_CANGL
MEARPRLIIKMLLFRHVYVMKTPFPSLFGISMMISICINVVTLLAKHAVFKGLASLLPPYINTYHHVLSRKMKFNAPLHMARAGGTVIIGVLDHQLQSSHFNL